GWIPSTEGVRTNRYKYTKYTDEPGAVEELYDLEVDMQEETNLAENPKYRPRLDALRVRREAWLRRLDEWRPDQPWNDPS
ncbi:MAG: DUF4976 domain-containing protein, partial [Bryobacterales bacterium]|nr:DUF4976 domain-containing protein [Bryobacterales bacterium]